MGQESLYVRKMDEDYWDKVEEISKDLGMSKSLLVVMMIKAVLRVDGSEKHVIRDLEDVKRFGAW